VYGAWAARRAGVPHVIAMHGGRYYAQRLRRRLALRAAVALSARTVAVSEDSTRRLVRDLHLAPGRVATIPNGVPYAPPERVRLREELGLGAADRLLVSVGNLYPVKGHLFLVEALARVARQHPTAHLAIAGRGEQEPALRACAEAHGIADRVHLLGLRADVPAVLAAADVFVLPSLSEGLPLALLEAMLAGRPIVSSNVGEVAVALAHGEAGVLVPPGDAAALAGALDRVLRDREASAQLGARAARRAAAEYELSRMVARWVSLYEVVLGERGGARVAGGAARVRPERA
jgi:glycosyltransferase involved in cell wall biosynthesis